MTSRSDENIAAQTPQAIFRHLRFSFVGLRIFFLSSTISSKLSPLFFESLSYVFVFCLFILFFVFFSIKNLKKEKKNIFASSSLSSSAGFYRPNFLTSFIFLIPFLDF